MRDRDSLEMFWVSDGRVNLPAETNQTRQQGNLIGYRRDCLFQLGFTLRSTYDIYQFDITICGFLEAKTLERLIDRQQRRMRCRCASLGHLDARATIA